MQGTGISGPESPFQFCDPNCRSKENLVAVNGNAKLYQFCLAVYWLYRKPRAAVHAQAVWVRVQNLNKPIFFLKSTIVVIPGSLCTYH